MGRWSGVATSAIDLLSRGPHTQFGRMASEKLLPNGNMPTQLHVVDSLLPHTYAAEGACSAAASASCAFAQEKSGAHALLPLVTIRRASVPGGRVARTCR